MKSVLKIFSSLIVLGVHAIAADVEALYLRHLVKQPPSSSRRQQRHPCLWVRHNCTECGLVDPSSTGWVTCRVWFAAGVTGV